MKVEAYTIYRQNQSGLCCASATLQTWGRPLMRILFWAL